MNKLISFVKELTKAEVKELNSSERIGRKYFYMSKELKELKDSINLEPYSAGIFLGELKNNKFMPSIALLDILANYTDKKLFINEKGQTMFLYGKDVFPENNEKNEVLGYGELKKDKKIILKHILDRGDFLRREN